MLYDRPNGQTLQGRVFGMCKTEVGAKISKLDSAIAKDVQGILTAVVEAKMHDAAGRGSTTPSSSTETQTSLTCRCFTSRFGLLIWHKPWDLLCVSRSAYLQRLQCSPTRGKCSFGKIVTLRTRGNGFRRRMSDAKGLIDLVQRLSVQHSPRRCQS